MGGTQANILTIIIMPRYIMFSIQPKGVQRKGINIQIIIQNNARERKILINGQTTTLESMPIGVILPKKLTVTGLVAV